MGQVGPQETVLGAFAMREDEWLLCATIHRHNPFISALPSEW